MKIVGIVCRTNKNIDDRYNFECLESVSRVFSKYDDVVPVLILPTKDIVYSETKSSEECIFDNDKYKKLDAKYNAVIHSTSWKVSKPIRALANMLRKLKKKVKTCFKK